MTVTEDNLLTLNITTSKQDVYLKLTVYDNGEEIVSATGKGSVQIPAVIFQKDHIENGAELVPNSSRPSNKKVFSIKTQINLFILFVN